MTYAEACELLAKCARERLSGLIRGWSGSLSARVPGEDGAHTVAVKRSGGDPLTSDAYCLVDPDGGLLEPAGARQSLMTRVHCSIYRRLPRVGSAIVVRGPYADALCTTIGHIPTSLEMAWALDGEPAVLPIDHLRCSNIGEFASHMERLVPEALAAGATTVCVPWYGTWTVGRDVEEAATCGQAVEDFAKGAFLRVTLAKALAQEPPTLPAWFCDVLSATERPR